MSYYGYPKCARVQLVVIKTMNSDVVQIDLDRLD